MKIATYIRQQTIQTTDRISFLADLAPFQALDTVHRVHSTRMSIHWTPERNVVLSIVTYRCKNLNTELLQELLKIINSLQVLVDCALVSHPPCRELSYTHLYMNNMFNTLLLSLQSQSTLFYGTKISLWFFMFSYLRASFERPLRLRYCFRCSSGLYGYFAKSTVRITLTTLCYQQNFFIKRQCFVNKRNEKTKPLCHSLWYIF